MLFFCFRMFRKHSKSNILMISWNVYFYHSLTVGRTYLWKVCAWRYSMRQMHYGNTLYAFF